MKRLLALLLLFSVVVAPAAHADSDSAFLAALDSHGIGYVSPEAAFMAGHYACSELYGGATPAEVAQEVINSTNLDDYHARVFVRAAIGAYCPHGWRPRSGVKVA